jgi:hypothetical protein
MRSATDPAVVDLQLARAYVPICWCLLALSAALMLVFLSPVADHLRALHWVLVAVAACVWRQVVPERIFAGSSLLSFVAAASVLNEFRALRAAVAVEPWRGVMPVLWLLQFAYSNAPLVLRAELDVRWMWVVWAVTIALCAHTTPPPPEPWFADAVRVAAFVLCSIVWLYTAQAASLSYTRTNDCTACWLRFASLLFLPTPASALLLCATVVVCVLPRGRWCGGGAAAESLGAIESSAAVAVVETDDDIELFRRAREAAASSSAKDA